VSVNTKQGQRLHMVIFVQASSQFSLSSLAIPYCPSLLTISSHPSTKLLHFDLLCLLNLHTISLWL